MKGFEEALAALDLPSRGGDFAQRTYASLCNVGWKRDDDSGAYTCSWRYAGGLVDGLLRQRHGDYMEFYCSGGEGTVDPEVAELLAAEGWVPCSHAEATFLSARPEHRAFHAAVWALEREHGKRTMVGPGPDGTRVMAFRDGESFVVDFASGEVWRNAGGTMFDDDPPARGERVATYTTPTGKVLLDGDFERLANEEARERSGGDE
jgi:hypothetical protein